MAAKNLAVLGEKLGVEVSLGGGIWTIEWGEGGIIEDVASLDPEIALQELEERLKERIRKEMRQLSLLNLSDLQNALRSSILLDLLEEAPQVIEAARWQVDDMRQ